MVSRPQLLPQELKEVVSAFSDTNEPKAVQESGLHLAGEKYFVIMANDKSLYGKKVRTSIIMFRAPLHPHHGQTSTPEQKTADAKVYPLSAGQRRCRDRQNQTNSPYHTLPGEHTTRPGSNDGREARRLSRQYGILASKAG